MYYQKTFYAKLLHLSEGSSPRNVYLLKVKNRNTRKRCEICSKIAINTPERGRYVSLYEWNISFQWVKKRRWLALHSKY